MHKIFLIALLIAVNGVSVSRAQSEHVEVLDPRALPLGDGRISTQPRRGHVFSCTTQFHGGGARRDGDWIRGTTWDATRKLWVQGNVTWANATFTITAAGGERQVTGNGLPINHTTGVFPVRRDDPAFQIDRNPNSIETQRVGFSLPLMPALAQSPTCVNMGMIGVALSGVALFNALDGEGRDAMAHEVQDRCNGHPEMRGQYHYHGPSACIPGANGNGALVGYALDGFGIYSTHDAAGREITNADLDECHGRTGRILWDGREVTMYHYVLTREYPYSIGCFRGTPARLQARFDGGPPPGKGPGAMRQPPPEALAACSGRTDGAQCRFISPRGDAISGTCRSPAGALACMPGMR